MRNRTETQINGQISLYLIRHGSTKANEEHRYLGKTDEPLSEKGIQEMQQRAGEKKMAVPEAVFVSPVKRCVQSAQILFPDVKRIEIPQWQEMDFGLFEYKNYAELNGNPEYQAWIDSGGRLPFPGGESREEFLARCVQGMEYVSAVLSRMQQENNDVNQESYGRFSAAAVVHGGTIMALLSHYCGEDYFSYQVENGGGYQCMISVNGENTEMEIEVKL